MVQPPPPSPSDPDVDQRAELVALFDRDLPRVYGYVLGRCRSVAVAEEVTSETFAAAARAVTTNRVAQLSTAWLIGVARHKLVDHWRTRAREERSLALVADDPGPDEPWDARLDALRAQAVLDRLGPHHVSALTLRYVDDLPVAEVARVLGRTEHATEALLVRARRAFRAEYERDEGRDDEDGMEEPR